MANRETTLRCLLEFSTSINDLRSQLEQHKWDCATPLVVLKAEHINSVLSRFSSGDLSENEVEEWANLLELRDDISFDEENKNAIKSVLYELANPYLTYPLTTSRARHLSALLFPAA